MHVHSHNSTLKVQWSDHFCGLVNLDSQVVHLMHHQLIPHEYKFFHVTNVFVYMRTVYEIVVQCKSALTTTSLFYFWYTSCFQRYYIMCIAVMVPTCSYAARKANEKNNVNQRKYTTVKRIYNYYQQQQQKSITKFSDYWYKN